MNRLTLIISFILLAMTGNAQNRFPKPDFESGYEYPVYHYIIPDEAVWVIADISLLVILMGIVAWAVIRRRVRTPVIAVSLFSVLYFGFFRGGCVCSIGSIQNIALALADTTYAVPLVVVLIFILPIIFTLLFGRVFCAGVCPFGALQELVNIKNYRLSKAVTLVLGIIPWFYLTFAVLFAITRSGFIICRFDPFIGIFRFGGDITLILFGILLLIASIFTGRPFCRFICPYGALLSLFARVSVWKAKVAPKQCINCELCHNACPVDAIRPPYDNRVKESRTKGVHRILSYLLILPFMIVTGTVIMRSMSDSLSHINKEVRLYNMVAEYEAQPQNVQSPDDIQAFYGQGGHIEDLAKRSETIKQDFKRYSTYAGAFLGGIIGFTLIGLSLKRTRRYYEIDDATCVSCARCFSYCPDKSGVPNQMH